MLVCQRARGARRVRAGAEKTARENKGGRLFCRPKTPPSAKNNIEHGGAGGGGAAEDTKLGTADGDTCVEQAVTWRAFILQTPEEVFLHFF